MSAILDAHATAIHVMALALALLSVCFWAGCEIAGIMRRASRRRFHDSFVQPAERRRDRRRA